MSISIHFFYFIYDILNPYRSFATDLNWIFFSFTLFYISLPLPEYVFDQYFWYVIGAPPDDQRYANRFGTKWPLSQSILVHMHAYYARVHAYCIPSEDLEEGTVNPSSTALVQARHETVNGRWILGCPLFFDFNFFFWRMISDFYFHIYFSFFVENTHK